MRNIKLSIQYDGTRYDGWQKQGNTNKTIQGKIEAVLSQVLNESIEIYGSGRTDSGVHAYNQVANFHTESNIDSEELIKKVNISLPNDIVVKSAELVEESFHSRYSAKGKKYLYRIWNDKFHNLFLDRYCTHIIDQLDVTSMKIAAKYLIGEYDFSSFTSQKSKKKSMVRTIYSIDFNVNNEQIEIIFYGNGFLYNMVRIICGTLLEVGLGKICPDDIIKILNKKDMSFAGYTAPAKGLFLYEVEY